MKKIIINADDFGYSKIFNEEILFLAESGKITGISVMVDHLDKSQKEQIKKVKKYKDILGLHIDFENIDLEKINFFEEVKRQFDEFLKIFDFEPIFLDMHKYSYREEGQKAMEKFCMENNIYFRNLSGIKNNLTTSEKKITGSFLEFDEILEKIKNLPNKNSTTTILFHPGKFDIESKSLFNEGRIKDIRNIILLNDFIDKNNDKYQKIGYLDL